MADVIALPTAAAEPVYNKRRPGSYGKKIASLQMAALRRRRQTELRERNQEPFERGELDDKASTEESIQALEWLLYEARKGNLSGMSVAFLQSDGDENAILTGLYKARPELALKAALRLSSHLAPGNA